MSSKEYDLIIFGASGFTGLMIVRELVISIKQNLNELSTLKWAVAGRSLTKLEQTLNTVGTELGKNLSQTPKIEADVENDDSIDSMASRTKVLINNVGPYRYYGNCVVAACVRHGTHYLDLSGELAFIENNQLQFEREARESGSLVISTCGYVSLPCDVGVQFLKKHFNGILHSVEIFSAIHEGLQGYSIHAHTLNTMMRTPEDNAEYSSIHNRWAATFQTEKLPQSRINVPQRMFPFRQANLPGWNVPFPRVDKTIVQRTQHYNWTAFNERPVQVQKYYNAPSLWSLVGSVFPIAIAGLLSIFAFGQNLLKKYPDTLTFGLFSSNGPTRAQMETTHFTYHLIGKGWANPLNLDPNSEPSTKFDKQMTVLVTGRDYSYLATSTCITQVALTVLAERDKMPKGGILTPGSAFRDTNLVQRLHQRELKFEIVSN